MNTDTNNEMLSSEAFRTLISKRWKVALILTVIMLTLYFGYLLLIAFNKEALATIVGADITLAIPVGLGLIISSWLLTGVYVYWANNHYDEAVEDLKKKITK